MATVGRCSSRSTRPGFTVDSIVWVRHGTDKLWPAYVKEVLSGSLEVEFVEAPKPDCDEYSYESGTVTLTCITVPRVLSFYDGLVSYFSDKSDDQLLYAHPFPHEALQDTLRWIGTAHTDLCSQRVLSHPVMQAIEADGRVKAIADTATEAAAIVTGAVAKHFSGSAEQQGCAKPATKPAAKPAAKQAAKQAAKPAPKPAPKSAKVQRKMQAPAAASGDDLNNLYGSFLLDCAEGTNSMKRKKCDQDPDCAKVEKELKNALGPDKANYEVVKLTQSGSDAVTHALLDATGGDLSTLVVAQGLYVAGDSMLLRGWSTSGGDIPGMMTAGEGRGLCLLLNLWCYT